MDTRRVALKRWDDRPSLSLPMAALTKSRPTQLEDNKITLSSSIPTPFSSADRDYILHSNTNGLHHSITPSIMDEHPPLIQESQVDGEVLLNADRVVSSFMLPSNQVSYGYFNSGSTSYTVNSTRPSICSIYP
jgi:hypothetical protein